VSRVDIVRTATDDLRGVWRMMRRFARGDGELDTTLDAPVVDPRLGPQVVKFASIGVVSTVVFAALFALLDGPIGPVGADVIALLVCAFANTAANRRLTFALRGRAGRVRHYLAGTALSLLPLALTLAALAMLAALGLSSLVVTLLILTAANLLATVARFLLLRNWVFKP
jgi:putative flippase GtrA